MFAAPYSFSRRSGTRSESDLGCPFSAASYTPEPGVPTPRMRNLDASLGILGWLHVAGQYFNGDCDKCGTDIVNNQAVAVDSDYVGYKLGLGVNIGLDKIGLNDRTDFVLRGNYVDVSLINPGVSNNGDEGWSAEGLFRSQISDRAEVMIGYEYTDLGSVKNSDLIVGLGYQVGLGITLTADAIVFDTDTGFALGIRWYFGNLIFGNRDSIVR